MRPSFFSYQGPLPASKSLLNRALIVQSFFPELKIGGESQCEDVIHLRKALWQLSYEGSQQFHCGAGGTSLRFLMARLSRVPGKYELYGDQRLMSRPHHGLIKALKQLGVQVSCPEDACMQITSTGWSLPGGALSVTDPTSSQSLSALLLSAWNLEKDLLIEFDPENQASIGYLHMTLDFLKDLGMELEVDVGSIRVPAGQKIQKSQIDIEPDMSSAFALAACALSNGNLRIHKFPRTSGQPDFVFVELLKSMGADINYDSQFQILTVKSSSHLEGVERNLKDTPDIFPVLAVLLSRAHGVSELSGLETLAYKESNRLENTRNLLQNLGYDCLYQNKKFKIEGRPDHIPLGSLEFDPDQDHRMAMAAALAQRQGADLQILNPKVINKSFPEFWEILQSC